MTVCDGRIFSNSQSGASIIEVLLAMGIVAIAAPFVYDRIADTNRALADMRAASQIIALREGMLNFVRMNQDKWPDVAQIQLSPDEVAAISDRPTAVFIDKYSVRGATVTDVYMGFDLGLPAVRTARVARNIGMDAAVVGDDGVAYGAAFAVAAPEFKAGDLVYRVTRDFSGEDRTRFLHRGTSGEDDLNVMLRDLNMGGHNILDVGTVVADRARLRGASTTFWETDTATCDSAYFSAGANMDGGDVEIGTLRVTDDITGFRSITADTLNGRGYTTSGRVIADRATVSNSVNVSHDFVLKSDTTRTISGFTGMTVNTAALPYVSATEMVFYENFGLTVSGELLMSTTPPIKLGSWSFPSTTPPRFTQLRLARAALPPAPDAGEFDAILGDDWATRPSAATVATGGLE